MTAPRVKLSDAERCQLAHVAAFRCAANLSAPQANGKAQRVLAEEMRGAAAEYAVAKHLGVFWPLDLGRQHLADAGRLHVRSVDRDPRADGTGKRLLIRADDPADGVFVLVEQAAPAEFVLVGWKLAGEARRPEWRRNPDGRGECWLVPREQLEPTEALETPLPRRGSAADGKRVQ